MGWRSRVSGQSGIGWSRADLRSARLVRDSSGGRSHDFAPDGLGYWIATTEGVVVEFGQAQHYGDMKGTALNKPIVGMVATSTGRGYWLVVGDGGIFSFGDATFTVLRSSD